MIARAGCENRHPSHEAPATPPAKMRTYIVDALNKLFDAAFHGTSKSKVVLHPLDKVLLVCTMFLTGCATERESATSPFFPTRNLAQRSEEYGDEISYWDGAASRGAPRIVIDLEQQRAYFYKGGKIVGISVVSTGREGYDTPSGEFRITQKDLTHVSSIYGDYVDRNGQVVMENVDVTQDPRPHGTVFRGAPMPYFLQNQRGHWDARRLSAWLSGITRLYSHAKGNGGSFFSKCANRYACGNSSRAAAGLPTHSTGW